MTKTTFQQLRKPKSKRNAVFALKESLKGKKHTKTQLVFRPAYKCLYMWKTDMNNN